MTSWPDYINRRLLLSPNGLSVLRAVLALILPFLLLSKSAWLYILAGFLFVFAALTDYWDGEWARRYNRQTNSGKIVDPTADKFLILAPLAAFAHLKIISVWWLVPIFLREIVVTFCRIGWYQEGAAVGAEKLGKIKLVTQAGTVAFAYFLFLSLEIPALGWTSGIFRLLTDGWMIAAVILTLASGISFLKVNASKFKSPAFAKYVSATGVGLIPVVPGTWGSLAGLLLAWLCHFNGVVYLVTLLALIAVGYWAVGRLDLSQNHDPSFVVMDETCGMMLTLFAMPLDLSCYLVGFFLFRLFDIVKPYPCRGLEKLPGWWGILCDDLGAAVYAWIILAYLYL